MTDLEMRETLRTAMADWDAATDEERAAALALVADAAEAVERFGDDELEAYAASLGVVVESFTVAADGTVTK